MCIYTYSSLFASESYLTDIIAISGYKVSLASCEIGLYVRVPFGEIVARTDEGLPWERKGFNCDRRTGDFLRSLDPHVGAVLRRRGCSSFHRRKSLFFSSFRRGPSLAESLRIVERSSFRARRRPRDLMPRGHVGASSILLFLRPFPHFFHHTPPVSSYPVLPCPTFSSALMSGIRIRGRHVLSGWWYLVIRTNTCLSFDTL